jgi:hypothetical protein
MPVRHWRFKRANRLNILPGIHLVGHSSGQPRDDLA